MLGLFGLSSTRPWESNSLAPKLEVPPGLGAALGDAVEVVPAGGPSVASAEIAPGGPGARLTGSVAVSGGSRDGSGGGPLLAVSPGRPVVATVPVTTPAPAAPQPQPPATPVEVEPVAAAPQPAPATQPAAPSPVVASAGGGGPGTSGMPGSEKEPEDEPEEGCEGDEYVIAVGAEEGASEGELAGFKIVVHRLGTDGSESEFALEGDLSAVDALVELLTAEGNCVRTVLEPPQAGETPELTVP